MLRYLMSLALWGLVLTPSVAWGQFVTPWKMARSPQVIPFAAPTPSHGHPSAFAVAPAIPAWPSTHWQDAPHKQDVQFRAKSRHCGTATECLRAGDFNFYRTELHLPAGVSVSSLKLRFWGVDDGIRVTIFNALHPQGVTPQSGYLALDDMSSVGPAGSGTTGELRSYIQAGGVNVIVVTHVDDCCASMVVERVEILRNGARVQTNGLPEIRSQPRPFALPAQLYQYPMRVVDPEQQTLQFRLLKGPAGAQVSATSGLVTWTPTTSDLGQPRAFAVQACDTQGGCVDQSWSVSVVSSSPNQPPQIRSTPGAFVRVDRTYEYTIDAYDADVWDQPHLTVRFRAKPADASFDPVEKKLSWKPSQVGQWARFEVEVCDMEAACVTQAWTVVVRDVRTPVIRSRPAVRVLVGSDYVYRPTLWAPEVNAQYAWKLLAGPNLYFNAKTGEIQWPGATASTAGKAFDFGLQVCLRQRCATQRWKVTVAAAGSQAVAAFATAPSGYVVAGQIYTYQPTFAPADASPTVTWPVLPSGAAINGGVLAWPSQAGDAGKKVSFSAKACFATDCTTLSWSVEVLWPNRPPVITSQPSTSGYPSQPYRYQVQAKDRDPFDEELRFVLRQGPKDAQLNPATGALRWTPQGSDVGGVAFRVAACDLRGACGEQTWRVAVVAAQVVISSQPSETGEIDRPYTYQPTLTWQPNTPLPGSWQLGQAPDSMTIEGSSGAVRWRPDAQDGGRGHLVSLSFCLDAGPCVKQSWTIQIGALRPVTPPRFASQPPTQAQGGETYTHSFAFADGASDAITLRLLEASGDAALKGLVLTWKPTPEEAGKTLSFTVEACSERSCARLSWQVEVLPTASGQACSVSSPCPNGQSCLGGTCQPVGVSSQTPGDQQKGWGATHQTTAGELPVAVGCSCQTHPDQRPTMKWPDILVFALAFFFWLRRMCAKGSAAGS